MENAFSREIPTLKEIMDDRQTAATIEAMMLGIFRKLGIEFDKVRRAVFGCLIQAYLTDSHDTEGFEIASRGILDEFGITYHLPRLLGDRASTVYGQVKKRLLQGSVLDAGCGDGQIGSMIASGGWAVSLADVFEHPYVTAMVRNSSEGGEEFTFNLIQQGEALPFADNSFDNIVYATVLHHTNDPVYYLGEGMRVVKPGGRVVLVESVFGVSDSSESTTQNDMTRMLTSLSTDQQFMINVFFDLFYNRVITYSDDPEKKVNVPWNFNTSEGWDSKAAELGLAHEETQLCGVDIQAVPEFHTVHSYSVPI